MRTVTYNAGAYLVEELLRAGVVSRFIEDGGDILLFETRAKQRVSIHLIESSIERYEIKSILDGNEAQHIYTLFILWGDRLLPSDGWQIAPPDWLEVLIDLYSERVYAYDIYGSEIFVFPVLFERVGWTRERRARYGTTVHIGQLHGRAAQTAFGSWRVAGFGQMGNPAAYAVPDSAHPLAAARAILGVEADDDEETIKKAYRFLARRYHPDLNRSGEATARMQQINAAYALIMDARSPSQ
jgi:hypothetical protein